ncbi:helix-turn-helix transcriptional regulator [Pedobacter agri]|uniref:helix-turn-helix domain-containing protein n=1 Tax=Pedobacter agri TaxID=454586 RepID=UPI00292D07D4|nr:helix-turn-helix transcriptional regulator [Pedobacter agri]
MPLEPNEQKYLNDFGAKVRELRTSKGLSMQQLANVAGIELSQVYRIEKGKINPKLTTIILLTEALDTVIEKLITTT